MKRKIVGIFVMMLIINVGIPIGVSENFGEELDQYSTEDSWGFDGFILPGYGWAQSFEPTMKKLSRVEIKIEKSGDPGMLTFAIRKILIDVDLVTMYLPSALIPAGTNWLTFDFDDLIVEPGETYYIFVDAERGFGDIYYEWRGTENNPYSGGSGWFYDLFSDVWNARPNIDFCFKTYGIKGLSKTENLNQPFIQFLENHPNLFPILRQILGLN